MGRLEIRRAVIRSLEESGQIEVRVVAMTDSRATVK